MKGCLEGLKFNAAGIALLYTDTNHEPNITALYLLAVHLHSVSKAPSRIQNITNFV